MTSLSRNCTASAYALGCASASVDRCRVLILIVFSEFVLSDVLGLINFLFFGMGILD